MGKSINHRPPLFRAEARPRGETGAPLGTRPIAWRTIIAVLAATAALAIGFSAFAGVSRKETLEGYVQPTGGTVRVAAPRAGTLGSINIALGQQVQRGAPLFLIETESDLASGNSLTAVRAGALDQQAHELRGRLQAERSRASLEGAQARARLEGLEAEARSIAEQRSLQTERIATTEERLKALAPLRERGFISEDQYRNREEYLLSLRQGLSAIERQLTENRREQTRARIEYREVPAGLADRTAQLRSNLAELEQKRAEAGAQGAQLVRAPIGGRVAALRAKQGQFVSADTPILTIASGSSRLSAALFASPEVVGLVRPGQSVRLMFDAFPVARFGALNGTVAAVSTTALSADESDGPARYRVDVALEKQTISANGAEALLQPDMTLRGDIVLEKRSLLEWLFQPLLTARARR